MTEHEHQERQEAFNDVFRRLDRKEEAEEPREDWEREQEVEAIQNDDR